MKCFAFTSKFQKKFTIRCSTGEYVSSVLVFIDSDSLICSDAMARGMDIDDVQYVISYDPPPYIKTYIHRVGRTARAGKEGTALSLLQKKEVCTIN